MYCFTWKTVSQIWTDRDQWLTFYYSSELCEVGQTLLYTHVTRRVPHQTQLLQNVYVHLLQTQNKLDQLANTHAATHYKTIDILPHGHSAECHQLLFHFSHYIRCSNWGAFKDTCGLQAAYQSGYCLMSLMKGTWDREPVYLSGLLSPLLTERIPGLGQRALPLWLRK